MVDFSGMVAPFLRSIKYTEAPFGEGVVRPRSEQSLGDMLQGKSMRIVCPNRLLLNARWPLLAYNWLNDRVASELFNEIYH